MLCPEVFNFEVPHSTSHVHNNISNEHVLKKIKKFQFPHLVTVILPDILRVPEIITKTFSSESKYYKISDFSLSELVNKPFVNCFIKKGSLSLLSINTRLDCDNCVAVTSGGYLILNLDKQSYQSLGLDGKPSHFCKRNKERFVVRVNLKLELLKPGSKAWERVKHSLDKLGRFSVILKWEPPAMCPPICPSSIAKYLVDRGYDVSYSDLIHEVNTLYSLRAPIFNTSSYSEDEIIAFSEWLGMICVNGDTEVGSPDNYLSSYEVPEPNRTLGQVKVLQWRGLFSNAQVEKFYEMLRKLSDEQEEEWICMYVQGFSDAAIGWHNAEHHYYTNGDNSYLLIFHKKSNVLLTNECSKKQYK